jgi:hypothetical protein
MEGLVVQLLRLHRQTLDLLLLRDMVGDHLLPLLRLRDMVVVLLILLRLLDMAVVLRLRTLDKVDMGLLRLKRPHDMEVDCLLGRLEEPAMAMEHL